MSEELIQRNLVAAPEHMGAWDYYNIGSTTLKALKAAKIIPKKDYVAYESKKPDALIIKKPVVIAAVEFKQPSQLRTKKQIQDAIEQELGTAQILNARIYIVTDGKKTFWINPLTGNAILTEGGEPVSTVFDQHSDDCIKLISRILTSIDKDNDTLQAASVVDPLPLAQQVWQDLWAVSGATPENCLYTFVEVFAFKYLSDLGVLPGMYSFNHLLSQYSNNSNNEVLNFYAQSVRPKIKELFPGNPKDKTTIINGTIFVSKDDNAVDGYSTVFKKILEKFEKFGTLENIDYDFKSKLFETFLKESISKKNWGQFFTPLKVVRSIVSMVDIHPNMSICDPACGVGKFLLEPVLHDLNRYYKIEDGKLKPLIKLSGFDKGFDKDEQKTIILAKANMLIYLSSLIRENPGLTVDFANLFNDTFLLQTNSILGTLAHPIKDEYDLILTNPPYVMSGSSNLKEEISKRDELKNYFSISAMGIEGLFMEWIVRALKPGGKAFVVVPDGIMNRSNDKRLRDFILEECDVDAVISLPINTFFTTNKKTYILAVTKKVPVLHDGISVKERQTSPVFTYLCSEIGETRDVYRFDLEQNDLAEAAGLFNMFKGARQFFKTDDKRCKIMDIKAFYDGSHWSVERWWTREERIELGIEDEVESVSVEGFISLIEDAATTLSDFQEPLREIAKKKIPTQHNIEVSLSDETLFELSIGKRVLRKDFQIYRGDIPVYSANVFTPFVCSDTSNITDYSYPYVIWGIDGNFEFNVVGMGKPFATTDHCGAIKILNSNIDPFYLAHMLKENSHIYGFDRGLRASLTNMKRIKLSIPITNDGTFDIEYQRFIANQLEAISQVKNEVKEKRNTICSVAVTVGKIDQQKYRSVKLTDKSLFLLITKGIGFNKTKLFSIDTCCPDDVPVYAAGRSPIGYIKPLTDVEPIFADHFKPILSFASNGDGSAGRNFVLHKCPFYLNTDRIAIHILSDKVLPEYLLSQLHDMKKKFHFGHSFKANRHNLQIVSIDIPIDKDGEFDTEQQIDLSKSYREIEQCRYEVIEKLDGLLTQKIEY